MTLDTIVGMLVSILSIGFVVFGGYSLHAARRDEHAFKMRQLELDAQRTDREPTVRASRTPLRVVQGVQPGTCADCKNFDVELGQKEIASAPPFAHASAHVPPWRMGHQMKVDAEGKHLPLDQQGVSKEMRALRWEEMGACVYHEELRAPFDKCGQHEPRDAESVSA